MRRKEDKLRFVLYLSLLGILFPMAMTESQEQKKVLWVELNEPITPGSAEKVSALFKRRHLKNTTQFLFHLIHLAVLQIPRLR